MSITDIPPAVAPPVAPEFPDTPTSPGAPTTSPWRDRLVAVLFGLLGLSVFVGFWAFISWRNSDLPGPLDAFDELRSLLSDGFASSGPNGEGILRQLGDSLELTMKGFGLAALVGIPLGLAAGGNRRIWQAINPIVQQISTTRTSGELAFSSEWKKSCIGSPLGRIVGRGFNSSYRTTASYSSQSGQSWSDPGVFSRGRIPIPPNLESAFNVASFRP